MSMTIGIGDDSDEVDDDLLESDRDDDDDEVGTRKPRTRGGADADTDQDDDDADDDDADDDKSEDELRAELKKVRTAAATYSKQGARRRSALKEARARIKELEGKVDGDEPDDEEPKPDEKAAPDAKSIQRQIDRAKRDTEKKLREEHKNEMIDTRAEAALTRAGVSEKNLRLLKKELDHDELELLKGGVVDGLDDEIDRLKEEFPDLFRRPKSAQRRVNGGDDRDRSAKRGAKAMTATQRQAAQLQGRSR